MEGHGARYRIWNIFFFIILLPFIVLQVKNYAVSQELNGSKIAIDNLNQNISVYQQAHYVVNGVESKTRSGANNLLTYINGLRGELDRRGTTANESIASRLVQQTSLPQPSNLTHPDCENKLNKNPSNFSNQNDWANCNVIKYVKNQFSEFNNTLTSRIPLLLKNVHDPSVSDKVQAMSQGVDQLGKHFNVTLFAQIAEDPNFWKVYQQKTALYSILTTELDKFWDTYGSPVGIALNNENTTLNIKKADLELQGKITKSNKDDLANQLKSIQFPFGNIPIGLNEAAAIFPLALAAGFAISCYLLGDTIRLRKSLYESYRGKNGTDINIIQDLKMKVSLIAPL